MKRHLLALALLLAIPTLADEVQPSALETIEMSENKIVVNVQKQPMNEASNQKVVLKKNWLVVNIQVNGKVKVNPLTNTYEVE